MLRVLLLIAVLGVARHQTTSFAALIAAVGIAVGAAWAGLLSNFAAGSFLLIFRPFKVGDVIAAGGTSGTVREIGLFVTSIDTPDRVLTFVGNNKLFSDNRAELQRQPVAPGRLDGAAATGRRPDAAARSDRLTEMVPQCRTC